MKLLPKGWATDDTARAVGFFAQAALELVHKKSWESYKLPTLSPIWRLIELRKVSVSVMRGVLPQKALEPIIEEVNSSLCNDKVISKILQNKQIDVNDLGIRTDEKAHELVAISEFLISQIHPTYRAECEAFLIGECFGLKRRSEIYSALKNYLSDLTLSGHSKESIEEAVRQHFFEGATKVDRRLMRNFFSRFPTEKRKYRIFGVAGKDFILAAKIFGVKVASGRTVPATVRHQLIVGKNENIFTLEEEEFDHFSAGVTTGKYLSAVEAILGLFPGKSLGHKPDRLLVARPRQAACFEVPSALRFEKRVLSHSVKSAVSHVGRVQSLLSNGHRSDELVGANLIRSILTAALADQSSAPEVKLLTLWASFEALLPLVPDGATNRISHFLEYIVPAACISYPRECFVELSRDGDRLFPTKFRNFLSTIPGDLPAADKIAAVIINGSQDQKEALCEVFSSSPIALYRLLDLESKFGTAIDFEKTMKNHSERVKWQIHRIYRERNTVMHNGESSPFIDALLSNTHYYLLLIFANIEVVSKRYNGLSVSQALGAIKKLAQADYSKLNRAKASLKLNPVQSQSILLEIIAGHYGNTQPVN